MLEINQKFYNLLKEGEFSKIGNQEIKTITKIRYYKILDEPFTYCFILSFKECFLIPNFDDKLSEDDIFEILGEFYKNQKEIVFKFKNNIKVFNVNEIQYLYDKQKLLKNKNYKELNDSIMFAIIKFYQILNITKTQI
jgi:hypothetical protein|nr:MAG TPA: hypothetical protein [Caudoviricetes sp.]